MDNDEYIDTIDILTSGLDSWLVHFRCKRRCFFLFFFFRFGDFYLGFSVDGERANNGFFWIGHTINKPFTPHYATKNSQSVSYSAGEIHVIQS